MSLSTGAERVHRAGGVKRSPALSGEHTSRMQPDRMGDVWEAWKGGSTGSAVGFNSNAPGWLGSDDTPNRAT
jgi:hypothetical protein